MNTEWNNKKRAYHAAVAAHYDSYAAARSTWRDKNKYFYKRDLKTLQSIIPQNARVLEVGCGDGDLLSRLKPSYGVGIDVSQGMIDVAKLAHPNLHLECLNIELIDDMESLEGPFDFVLLPDIVGLLFDVQAVLDGLHRLASPNTRFVLTYHNRWWEPAANLWVKLGWAMPRPAINWFASYELSNLLKLENYDVIQVQKRELSPSRLFGFGSLINKFIAPLPGFNAFCWRTYIVARSRRSSSQRDASVTALVPCRNEKDNIEACVTRLPEMGKSTEILFVEGNSQDETYEECLRVKEAYPERNIRVLKQTGKGKGDAVRLGFHEAAGDIVMIVDSDLAVPPEYMPRVYDALASGDAEFVNCTRLIYPMEKDAMRPLNYVANRLFAKLLSYLLNQSLSDTLCGTKALYKDDYLRIEAERERLGSLDPFGDFDLIFGAALDNMRIVNIPVRYQARGYGQTQIARFADGLMLFKMVWRAFRQLKAR